MFRYSPLIFQLPLLLIYGRVLGGITSASQVRSEAPKGLSMNAAPTPSRTTLNEQAYQGSYNQSNFTELKSSDIVKDPGDPGKVCIVGDCANYPSATKTVDQYGSVGVPNLEELCVLWNNSCTGNVKSARNEFFSNTSEALRSNECFHKQPTGSSEPNSLKDCYEIESSQQLLQFGQAKAWMRSPQCLSAQAVWASSMPDLAVDSKYVPNEDLGAAYCCTKCGISVENVDIYYWPDLDIDTSCLSIIGKSTNPVDYGATTTSNEYDLLGRSSSTMSFSTYWGCIGQDASVTTTAYITKINSIMVKASSYNPWSPPPCPEPTLTATISNTTIEARGRYASIHARAQSLIIQPSITQDDGLPVSTVIVGYFTFTSPSIYANFHNIIGDDNCGDPVTIPTTMLTFSPGELSTIAGPLTDCGVDQHCSFSTKQYDFQDLPCPPQSVMEENWYKPQPGEPYRPLIAMPRQILQMNPLLGRCTDNFFTGYDPPRTLARATALSPTTTTEDYAALTIAPKPSPTPEAGASKTPTGENTSIKTPALVQPALEFKDEGLKPENEPSHPIPLQSSPTPSALDPEATSGDPQQVNNAKGTPGEETSPDPPAKPVQTIAVGAAVGDSDQRTDPITTSIPAQVDNAEIIGGQPDQAKPTDPGQTKNAPASSGDSAKENPSNDNESKTATILPNLDETPTQIISSGKPNESPPSHLAPPIFNPFLPFPNEILSIELPPSQSHDPKTATIFPSTKLDPTRADPPTKPSSPPDSNPVPAIFTAFLASPNEIYAIGGASRLRSQHSVLPNTAPTVDGPNQYISSARVDVLNYSPGSENSANPAPSQIPGPEIFVTAQAIATTFSNDAVADISGTALSPLPSQVSMEGGLDTYSASMKASRMSALSVGISGVGRVGDMPNMPITPATPAIMTTATAGSSIVATDTGLLASTPATPGKGEDYRNVGANARVEKRGLWAVVVMTMVMGLGMRVVG